VRDVVVDDRGVASSIALSSFDSRPST
jgi:hypothetical protein